MPAERLSIRKTKEVLEATELIAAHWESYSPSCSRTMRTARSLTSRGYLFDVLMTPSSQEMESPAKAGRFRLQETPFVGQVEEPRDDRSSDLPWALKSPPTRSSQVGRIGGLSGAGASTS